MWLNYMKCDNAFFVIIGKLEEINVVNFNAFNVVVLKVKSIYNDFR